MRVPAVGMIVPPAHGRVPRDGATLYGRSVSYIGEGLGLRNLSPDGYDAVIERVEALSARLADRGAEAIAFMGTSLTFYRGWEFHEQLITRMRQASALPATTMSLAVVEAMRALGMRRVAVATAYTEVVNERLRQFLEEAGLQVLAMRGMAVEDTDQAQQIPQAAIVRLCREVMQEATRGSSPNGMVISCGALDTLDLVPALEREYDLPVVGSSPAGFWAAIRLLGHTGAAAGYGRLFELAPKTPGCANKRGPHET